MEGKIKDCCAGLLNHICEQADCLQDVSKTHRLVVTLSNDERLTVEEREQLKKLPDFCAECVSSVVDHTQTSVISVALDVFNIETNFVKKGTECS